MQANVLVGRSGDLVICDLGAAQTGIQKGSRTDEQKPTVGTSAYLPPEYINGEQRKF